MQEVVWIVHKPKIGKKKDITLNKGSQHTKFLSVSSINTLCVYGGTIAYKTPWTEITFCWCKETPLNNNSFGKLSS